MYRLICSGVLLSSLPPVIAGAGVFSGPVTVYSNDDIYGTDMDIRSDGTVGFVYSSSQASTIDFVEYDGTLGAATAVNYSQFLNFGPSLAYDNDDNPYVAWYKASTLQLEYNMFDGSAWQSSSMSLGETRTSNSTLEVDDAGNVHALWLQREQYQANRIRYRMFDDSAGTWLAEQAVVDNTDGSPYRAPGNLAVSGDGEAHALTQMRVQSIRTGGTANSGPYYYSKVTDGLDFAQTQIPPNSASSDPRAGGLESFSRKVLEEAWRGSELDVVAIQWWPTVTDNTQDNASTGFVNLYLDVLGGSSSPIAVWGEQGSGPGVLSSASEVDMAIDIDGNHYVFFIAKDQTEATTNDVLYMQIVDATGVLVDDLMSVTDSSLQDISDLEVDIFGSTISISYVDNAGSEIDFLYQTYTIPEPATLGLILIGGAAALGRRRRQR